MVRHGLAIRSLVITVFLGVSLVGILGQAHEQRGCTLDVRVENDKRIFSLKDELVLDVALFNHESAPVFVYNRLAWGWGGGLRLVLQDGSGKPVQSPVMDDTILPPPSARDASILVRLGSDQFFGTRRVVDVKDVFPKPGRYELRVQYLSILSPEFVEENLRGLNVLWKGQSPIDSQVVSIEITP